MKRTQPANSNRTLVWLGGMVLVLLALGTVLAVTRPEPEFEPGTPEAVAHGYIAAVFAGDVDVAFTYLSDELQNRCLAEDLRRGWVPDSARVVITDTEVNGDRAVVRIRIGERQPGQPFSMGETSYEEMLIMTRTGDGWRISEAPWPIYFCPERNAP